jgi:hypothetical protein
MNDGTSKEMRDSRVAKAGRRPENESMQTLGFAASQWKTPSVPNGGRHLPPHATETGMVDGVKRQVDLQHQVRGWPTPGVHNSPDASPNSQRECDLRETVKDWPTPKAEGKEGRRGSDPRHGRVLEEESRSFPQAPATSTPGDASSSKTPASRRRLNPRFVSYLMGWPLIGGNGSDSLGMVSCHFKQRMRSRLSRLVSD